jgi:hypothetical protein
VLWKRPARSPGASWPLRGHREEIEEMKRDWDILLEHYAEMVPEGLESFGPEERRWVDRVLRPNVFADADGCLTASWMFTKAMVVQRDARKD